LSVEGTFTVDIVKRRVVTLDKYVVMNKLLETPAEIMSMKLENAKLSSRIAILQDEMTDKTELSSLKEKMTTLEKAVNFQMEVLVDKEKSISGLSSPVAVQKRTLSKSCKNLKGRGKKLLASHGVFSTHSASSSLVTQGPTHRQMVCGVCLLVYGMFHSSYFRLFIHMQNIMIFLSNIYSTHDTSSIRYRTLHQDVTEYSKERVKSS
jgi:hypothetical protein